MSYRSLRECLLDLERRGQLVRIREELDPDQEMAEVHRRVREAGGPAIYFERVKGSPFPAVSNLYGTKERARFIFRHTLERVKQAIRLKADPSLLFKQPLESAAAVLAGVHALPVKVLSGPVLEKQTSLSLLPQIKCWPGDGGAFILLPQVYTENQSRPGILRSNLGMYRVQISGNEYQQDREAGLHYQIRRDIGIHHHAALSRGEPLRVSIFVGGPPAHAFSAVMYLPEGLPEVAFAGVLAGRGFRYARRNDFAISADADFCITGTVVPGVLKPEGPFGDHLGYYALRHDFPVMKVESVYHRRDAVWPFTVVGRPPQEDSVFGSLVQEIAGPMLPREIPGVKRVLAVDAAGVHPLMLAVGTERFLPYAERKPQELLKQAHALLGYGPCALAKYLMMTSDEDCPGLDLHDFKAFFRHLLERIDWSRDLHFETSTTMDTLDYSGTGINQGSRLVMAAAGPKKRDLSARLPGGLRLPDGFGKPVFFMPGVVVLEAPAFQNYETAQAELELLCRFLENCPDRQGIACVVAADHSGFSAGCDRDFLWSVFTRSDPARDILGAGHFTRFKHWGCEGPLVIDARIKPHHAPAVEADPAVRRRVDSLAASGGPLHGIF
ncbi:MAG: UbiD family decarboxylase [Candidatus Omnitrophica bacterium]|nr:UbiD family decarboxylase [Candidatus Omnitrophota bacterium]